MYLREQLCLKVPLSAFLQLCPPNKWREYTICSSHLETGSKVVSLVVSQLVEPRTVSGAEGGAKTINKQLALAYNENTAPAESEEVAYRGAISSWLCNMPHRGNAKAGTDKALTGTPDTVATATEEVVADPSTTTLEYRLGMRSREAFFRIRTSTFNFPEDPKRPVVCIAAGTGIAPFRGFLRQEALLKSKRRIMLFFGVRRKDEDFLYRSELDPTYAKEVEGRDECSVARLPNYELVMAFSRENPKRKVYVQDKVKEHSGTVREILKESGAMLLVCGSTSMGAAVQENLKNYVGRQVVKDLLESKRYVEEVWGGH